MFARYIPIHFSLSYVYLLIFFFLLIVVSIGVRLAAIRFKYDVGIHIFYDKRIKNNKIVTNNENFSFHENILISIDNEV